MHRDSSICHAQPSKRRRNSRLCYFCCLFFYIDRGLEMILGILTLKTVVKEKEIRWRLCSVHERSSTSSTAFFFLAFKLKPYQKSATRTFTQRESLNVEERERLPLIDLAATWLPNTTESNEATCFCVFFRILEKQSILVEVLLSLLFVIHTCVTLLSCFTVSTPTEKSSAHETSHLPSLTTLAFSFLSSFFLAPLFLFQIFVPLSAVYKGLRRRTFCVVLVFPSSTSSFQLSFLCPSCWPGTALSSPGIDFWSMELVDYSCASTISRKRKMREQGDNNNFMDELNQDLLERVLSWLPTSSFFRLSSVCKRWKSVAASSTFKLACSTISFRDPWFFMVDPHLDQSVVFDSTERNWKKLNHQPLLCENSNKNSLPVAASGGLICFRNASGNFIISNPLTQSCQELPSPDLDFQNVSLHAIVMKSCSSGLNRRSYRLVLVYGRFPSLWFKLYNSSTNCWEDVLLSRKVDDSVDHDSSDDTAMYFLSTAGNLIATNMERSPTKQYSSVITTVNGEDIVYFVSFSGTIVACNLSQRCFLEFPRLLPVFSEYSIDVVECKGQMLVVMLSELLESATLRVWKYNETARIWQQIAAMPPALSHEWFGKKVDINCVGAGERILVCANSPEAELCTYLHCDVVENQWVELPKCSVDGEALEFMSAITFEPRIEASV